jgi:FkbM family methyltransferase
MSSLKDWVKKYRVLNQSLLILYKLVKAFFDIKINAHALREFRYEWRGEVGLGEQNLNFYQNIFKNLLQDQKLVILDVGANDGWFSKIAFRFWPIAKIISFEPLKSMHPFLEILKQQKGTYSYEKIGLGEENKKFMINEFGTSGLSSFKQIHSSYAYDSQFFNQQVNTSYEVDVLTLDDYIIDRKVEGDFCLKIDTQGFEMEVLRGSQKLFESKRIKVVIIELMTIEKYQGAALYHEIIGYLEIRGLRLVDIHNSYYEENGKLSEFDAVFTLI